MLIKPTIIVGTGLAGYTLAREFRKLDKQSPITILTADDGSVYSKPILSNALAKGITANNIATSDANQMADQLNASILTKTDVTAINPQQNIIYTVNSDKTQQELQYSNLVLAVGADQIQLPLEGNASDETISVNDLADYAIFRKRIEGAKKIAIIGGGLIGCEFANDLCSSGLEVQVIERTKLPLLNLLPEAASETLHSALMQIGVEWHLLKSVTAISRNGSKFELSLSTTDSNETTVINEIDLVLSAVGLRPRTALTNACGIKANRGIVVDQYLRTNISNIYALGDCAEINGLVLPYVLPLMNSARALAKTLAKQETKVTYPAMPIVIKTPAHPVVILPPPPDLEGQWQSTNTDSGTRSLYIDKNNNMRGFALTGNATKERNALIKEIPTLLD